MSGEYWEPWKPEVGQRVRVRISLECAYCLDPMFPKCYDRALSDDGRTGTVVTVGHGGCCLFDGEHDDLDPAHAAHTVWVKWDDRRDYDDPQIPGIDLDAHFAVAELEPIS